LRTFWQGFDNGKSAESFLSDDALLEPHVSEFNITGQAMKGWVLVAPEGVGDDG
jgi:hypothetical protein